MCTCRTVLTWGGKFWQMVSWSFQELNYFWEPYLPLPQVWLKSSIGAIIFREHIQVSTKCNCIRFTNYPCTECFSLTPLTSFTNSMCFMRHVITGQVYCCHAEYIRVEFYLVFLHRVPSTRPPIFLKFVAT